jgi:hypothetical protein
LPGTANPQVRQHQPLHFIIFSLPDSSVVLRDRRQKRVPFAFRKGYIDWPTLAT